MILEDSSTRAKVVSELNNLVTSRAMTIIFISLGCLLICQIIKLSIQNLKTITLILMEVQYSGVLGIMESFLTVHLKTTMPVLAEEL